MSTDCQLINKRKKFHIIIVVLLNVMNLLYKCNLFVYVYERFILIVIVVVVIVFLCKNDINKNCLMKMNNLNVTYRS